MPDRAPSLPVRRRPAAALACVLAWTGAADAQEEPRTMSLGRGKAEVVTYEAELGTVIIGDSSIAVASVAQSDLLVLTGLEGGVTNAIVLDETGRQIDEILVRVVAPGRQIVVWHGLDRDDQVCDPFCAPTGGAAPVAAASATAEDG